jgi:predicted PurR-regulated permease PerM
VKIEKKTIFRIFYCVLGCILFYWLLHETDRVKEFVAYLGDIFSPFVIGGVLAFILNAPMRFIENRLKFIKNEKVLRVSAILLTLLAIILLVAGIVMLLIPQIKDTIELLMSQMPEFYARVQTFVMEFLEARPQLKEMVMNNIDLQQFDWSGILEKLATFVSSSVGTIIAGAVVAVKDIFGVIFNLVISIVFAFYCLACKETLARQARRIAYSLLKEKMADQIVRIMRMTNSAFSNFLTGQCLEAVILGLMFVPAMAIFKMPYIPLICVLITVTALVPLVGAFVGCAVGAFFILVTDPMLAVGFVIMFLVIQQIEGNLIYPKVVGESIGLPGMWVLLAVAVGGGFFGVAGMFLMVPLASVLYTLLREHTHNRLTEREIDPDKLVDHPPELQSHFQMKRAKRKEKRKVRREERKNKRIVKVEGKDDGDD